MRVASINKKKSFFKHWSFFMYTQSNMTVFINTKYGRRVLYNNFVRQRVSNYLGYGGLKNDAMLINFSTL